MNASLRKFAALAGSGTVFLALGGCVGAFDPETDPASPLAPRVQALVDANRTYPRWADFPRATEPLPTPDSLAARVNALQGAGSDLSATVARLEWDAAEDPEALAAETRARVDAAQVSPVTQETLAEIEEFARRTRDRGRAPPPVDPRR